MTQGRDLSLLFDREDRSESGLFSYGEIYLLVDVEKAVFLYYKYVIVVVA